MSIARKMQRNKAKKEYKELMKSIPKSQRIPFSHVYKTMIEAQSNPEAFKMPTGESVAEATDVSNISEMFVDETNEA